MKRRGLWVILSLALSLVFLSSCQQATENTNLAPAASPTAETVNTAAIETELLKIENDWPRVLKEKDVEAVKRVEADDAVFVYPDGSIGDKNTDVKDIETGALSAESWELTDLKVNVLDKDAAVVSGRTTVKNGKYKLPNGKSIDISGQYRFIDTFVRRNGEWKLVAGASTKITGPEATASPMASPAATASPATTASPAAGASPAVSGSPGRRPVPPAKVSPVPKPTQ